MKRLFVLCLFLVLIPGSGFTQDKDRPKAKILLLISEQNIQGPSTNWWISGAEMSTIESNLAKLLKDSGYQIISLDAARNIIGRDKAFKVPELPDKEAVLLGRFTKADYAVSGRATASQGSIIAGSNMRPCYADATVKLIRVRNGVVIAALDAIGSSVNTDALLGGKDALSNSAVDLAAKIISNLTKKEGGK